MHLSWSGRVFALKFSEANRFLECYKKYMGFKSTDPLGSHTVSLSTERESAGFPDYLNKATFNWWAYLDSNQGPTGYEPVALAN